jgi:hypothetical protein
MKKITLTIFQNLQHILPKINKGISFEKEIISELDSFLSTGEGYRAKLLFSSIEAIDSNFKTQHVNTITERTGTTRRNLSIPLEDHGSIIADYIITMQDSSKRYISLKSSTGKTIANFGISDAFNNDLSINIKSNEWKSILAPFGIDKEKLELGLLAYQHKTNVKFDDIEYLKRRVNPKVYNILKYMWGTDYYYIKEEKDGFDAMYITEEFLTDFLLKNLYITEIKYPNKNSKSTTIKIESTKISYLIEIRDVKKGIKPTQMNLILKKIYK